MSQDLDSPFKEPPQLLVYVVSDIDPFMHAKEKLLLPAESNFQDFIREVAANRWVRHVTLSSSDHDSPPSLLHDDNVFPYKDDIATPEGGCPYFEWLKDWNSALRPVRSEDIEAGWFKPISPRIWRSIERNYYKGHNIGSQETARFGRTMADFHKSRKPDSSHVRLDIGWSSRLIIQSGIQSSSQPVQQAEWVPIDGEGDWQLLKRALKQNLEARVEMMHRSTQDQFDIHLRRHQMEAAIQDAGGMVPLSNIADLPGVE